MQPVECPNLYLDLDQTPRQRFAALSPDVLARASGLLSAVLVHLPPRLRMLADAVRLRTRNRFHAEAVALARVIGHDWRSIMLANVSYDLAMTMGCSTVALAGPKGPILARNMDWRIAGPVARSSYQMIWQERGQMRFITAGFPGGIGVVTGLSQRGFAFALNAIKGFHGLSKTGYPVLLFLRRVVEDAAGFDQALDMLSRQRLAAPAMFTLVGKENDQRVVIERTKGEHALRWASGGKPLYTTNHFHILARPQTDNPGELWRTSFTRYDALGRCTMTMPAEHDTSDEALLKMLADPHVIQDITAQHIVMRPRQGLMRVFVPGHLVTDVPV